MQADFEEPELFQARYQRNNKRGGLKNLRCFPTCAALHRERGFCGRMVVLRLRLSEPRPKLVVYGEFVPVSDKNAGLKVDDLVTVEKAKEICRDKANPTKPWMEGEAIEEGLGYARFAFNRDKKGWHYGWASNKHTCNASHALQAYVMEELGPDKLVVKGVFQSPQFTLFCRRRRRFAMVPSAPIAPPSTKKRTGKAGADVAMEEGDDEEDEDDLSDDGEDEQSGEEPEVGKGRHVKAAKAKPAPPPPKKRTASAVSGPKKKPRMVVVNSVTDKVASVVDRIKAARVERMLKEISRRSVARSKPAAISRPSSPVSGAEPFSSTDSASTSTGDEHHMSQAQFSSHLFECIDFFAGDSLLDDNILEGDFLGEIPAIETALDKERQKLVDDLSTYLLDEREFTDAICELSKTVSGKAKSTAIDQAAFDKFIGIISNNLEAFLARKGLSLKEFDELFPAEPSQPFQTGEEILARSAFMGIMGEDNYGASTEVSDVQPLSADLAGAEKLCGTWILAPFGASRASSSNATSSNATSEAAPQQVAAAAASPDEEIVATSSKDDGIESLRESLGYPWLLRKMLSFMEEKFHVELAGNVLSVRLQRRLFSSGAMTIVLDGEEHEWGMKLPMFEGISSVWKYRAWVNDGVVHHVHETGDGINSRMKRSMWVDDSDRLIIDVKLEEYNTVQGRWDTVARALQKAVRC